MHPILSSREKLFVYLGGWSLVGVLLAGHLAAQGDMVWYEALAFSLPLAVIYAFLSLSAWFLCRAFPLHQTGWMKLAVVFGIAAVVSSSLWVMVGEGVAWVIVQVAPFGALPMHTTTDARLLFGIGVILYILAVAVHYLMIAFEASRESERRALELRVLAHEAELRALRAQLDPHFLFNSLNSISALTTENPSSARSMTLLLSDFLRTSLRLGANKTITLKEELDLIDKFLKIEQVRFGERLRLEKHHDAATDNCLVPPLLLQPLVENAISHGIAHVVEGGTLHLTTERRGNRIAIVMENPYDPDRPKRKGTGLGLTNTRGRLLRLFDGDALIEATSTSSSFRIDISLPAIEHST